jgi:hypothetical protein
MTQQTLAQIRVIDPILTTHAQGYVRPGNVGKVLFPEVSVGQYAGQILEFGKESFRRYNTKRAPGAVTERITFGYSGKPYAIVPNALEALVPAESQLDAAAVPGLDLASDAVDVVMDVMELAHECECADIALATSNYDADHQKTLATTARWTNASNSDPTADIKTGSEAIRRSIGVRPNVAILSATAYAALATNKSIIERLKYTGRDSVTTEILARLWNVQTVVVGDAVVASGQDDGFGDVWGDHVVLAYVAPGGAGNKRNAARPSYGYTYTIRGMPAVRKPYQDNNRNSWVYGVNADRVPVLSGMTAGYLILNAGQSD